ncbi:unnamed protein product [Arctia plantaginis]|uniref:alanine transaminase n=1 Tax=Arctia plantaginis TaxID=874455 RepID=A0A8S1B4L3_ARCPL|nr:unnamed protein product [Arctia plantaginis]
MDNYEFGKSITFQNLNPHIIKLEYAIRGSLFHRLMEIEKELKDGVQMPFTNLIKANIGDGQSIGQKPISFIRQVLACVSYPNLLKTEYFPQDVKERAADILNGCDGNSVGSYTTSLGIDAVRQSVATYIEKRDSCKADWNNICLTPGASAAIKSCLKLFINNTNGQKTGVMLPVPQYPLYSATLAEYGLTQVEYYLDESKNWALTLEELERSHKEASKSCKIRVLVVINPGNPTGQVLTRENIEDVIKFAYKHSLFIFADEVYQQNIYEGIFYSFKKVLSEQKAPLNQVELVSFMSMSKGYMGECGFRGGWLEIVNMDPEVLNNLYKSISARHCPNTLGQAVVYCVVRPPVEGEPSYKLYAKEKADLMKSFATRAKMVEKMFNDMEGVSCNVVQGALYAFPRIEIPPKAIEAAKNVGQKPDEFYVLRLLEETGICMVPGSGFGQVPGTYHIRTTILPQLDLLKEMVDMLKKFHKKFIEEYSSD